MKKYLLVFWIGLLVAGWPLSALAEATPQSVSDSFQRLFPDMELPAFTQVSPDLHQFIIDGDSFYFSGDGKLLFSGRIWEVASGKELGEASRRRFRREAIEDLGAEQMVVYTPEDYRYTVHVFTDIECGFCRKFHSEMPELQRLGIRVKYLLTPLRGAESEQKALSVWCAKNRNQAMDLAKRGESIPEKSCANPIEEHLRVFKLIEARGTPALVFESGKVLGGYLPPEELLQELIRDAAQP